MLNMKKRYRNKIIMINWVVTSHLSGRLSRSVGVTVAESVQSVTTPVRKV